MSSTLLGVPPELTHSVAWLPPDATATVMEEMEGSSSSASSTSLSDMSHGRGSVVYPSNERVSVPPDASQLTV